MPPRASRAPRSQPATAEVGGVCRRRVWRATENSATNFKDHTDRSTTAQLHLRGHHQAPTAGSPTSLLDAANRQSKRRRRYARATMTSPERAAATDLRRTLSTIGSGFDGVPAFVGHHAALTTALHTAACSKGFSPTKGDAVVQANLLMRHVNQDLWALQTLAVRMTREHRLMTAKDSDSAAYFLFMSCDVHLFLVEARSLLDYLAQLIALAAHQPGQIKVTSFNALRNWVAEHPARLDRVLGLDLAGLVRGCTWFDEVKASRDAVVHRGGEALCMWSGTDEISFDLLMVPQPARVLRHIWKSRTGPFGDFRVYAALCFGRLVALVEDAASIVRARLPLSSTNGSQISHTGLGILKEWMLLALERLEG